MSSQTRAFTAPPARHTTHTELHEPFSTERRLRRGLRRTAGVLPLSLLLLLAGLEGGLGGDAAAGCAACTGVSGAALPHGAGSPEVCSSH